MIDIDHKQYREAAHSVGISDADLPTTIVQGAGRIFLGSHWPSSLATLRFPSLDSEGNSVIRIAEGGSASVDRKNVTMAHELIHETQSTSRRAIGKSIEYGVAVSGVYIGYRLGGESHAVSVALGVLGSLVGMRAGWMIAPHELEARRLAPGLAARYKMIVGDRETSP